MSIDMPALRLLFSGRDDIGKYVFTVLYIDRIMRFILTGM